MVRDTIKDKEYFIEYISEELERINKFKMKLRNKEVRADRIPNVERKVYDLQLQILIAKYSMGDPINSLITDYIVLVEKMKRSWIADCYEDMLWMLSIGIMLEIDDDVFNILVELVENSNVNDFLYNFIIHSRKDDVTYQNSPVLFEEPFESIPNIVMYEDKSQASNSMKAYLLEKWYEGHKDMGWYDSHRNQEKLYFGYWSFESGAIVKILGLDDSGLIDVPYYPFDMVHLQE